MTARRDTLDSFCPNQRRRRSTIVTMLTQEDEEVSITLPFDHSTQENLINITENRSQKNLIGEDIETIKRILSLQEDRIGMTFPEVDGQEANPHLFKPMARQYSAPIESQLEQGAVEEDDSGINRFSGILRQRERNQERRLTRISILIVWMFIGCHVWKLIPTAFEAGYSHNGLSHKNWPQWVLFIESISHFLVTFNSAVNFLIYAVM